MRQDLPEARAIDWCLRKRARNSQAKVRDEREQLRHAQYRGMETYHLREQGRAAATRAHDQHRRTTHRITGRSACSRSITSRYQVQKDVSRATGSAQLVLADEPSKRSVALRSKCLGFTR